VVRLGKIKCATIWVGLLVGIAVMRNEVEQFNDSTNHQFTNSTIHQFNDSTNQQRSVIEKKIKN